MWFCSNDQTLSSRDFVFKQFYTKEHSFPVVFFLILIQIGADKSSACQRKEKVGLSHARSFDVAYMENVDDEKHSPVS